MSSNAAASGLYGRRWRRIRKLYLSTHPLCTMCKEDGRLTPATELDHIQQHHGDKRLAYDWDNLQGLCSIHHRSYKAKLERSGQTAGCDDSGNPLQPGKHWRG